MIETNELLNKTQKVKEIINATSDIREAVLGEIRV